MNKSFVNSAERESVTPNDFTRSRFTPRRKSWISIAVALGLAGLQTPASAQQIPAVSSAAPTGSEEPLNEIVVTAQRREQSIQDVGIAVTAVSGDELRALNVVNGSDLAQIVPSLKMNEYSSAAVVFNIRGVSQNDYGDQQEPPVAVYQDDSYASSIVLASFPLFDLARAEVLRGPQGTLFGRNATGGAIQFISNQPSQTFDAYAHASYGSFNAVHFDGAVSRPLSETFAVRLAGEVSGGGSYYKSIEPGQPDLGGAHNAAFRVILKWTPGDQLSAWATIRYLNGEHEYSAAMVTHEPACPNAQLQGVYLAPNQSCAYWGSPPGAIATGYRNDSINPQRGGDPWYTAHTFPTYVSRYALGGQLHVEAKLDDVTVTSITDYQHAKKYYSEDTDGTPDNAADYYAGARIDQTSEELRVSGTAGANQWVGGAMGMIIDGKYHAGFDLPFFDYYPIADFTERTVSYAVFGQNEWQIAPKVKLIGGLRYWNDRRSAWFHGAENASTGVDVTYGTGGLSYDQNGVSQPLTGLTASASDAAKTFSGLTARAEVDYKPIDDLLVYLSYNRGSKSGGYTFSPATPFNAAAAVAYFNGIQYKPETLQSYEIGVKSSLSRTTTLNVSAFAYDYTNYQAFTQVGVEQTIVNLNAKEIGLEAELTSRPIRGLLLELNASSLSSRVRHVLLPDSVTYVDHDLPQAPHFSGGALARYEVPFGSGSAYIQGNVEHLSDFCFSTLCSPVDREPGYTVVNSRVGYRKGDFEVSVYAANLTNREYRIYAADNSLTAGFEYSTFAPPRIFGVSVNYNAGGAR